MFFLQFYVYERKLTTTAGVHGVVEMRSDSPTQSAPVPCGSGLVHVLLSMTNLSSPHGFEQSLVGAHSVYPPSMLHFNKYTTVRIN